MDEGQTNNPNVTPGSYPMIFWGLLAMVFPIAHITQQNSLIGSSSKLSFFLGHDTDVNISVPI